MAIEKYQWLSRSTNGYREVPMAIEKYQWLSRSTNGYREVPMAIEKYQWLSRSTNGYREVPMAIEKYQWLSRSTNGYREVPISMRNGNADLFKSTFLHVKASKAGIIATGVEMVGVSWVGADMADRSRMRLERHNAAFTVLAGLQACVDAQTAPSIKVSQP